MKAMILAAGHGARMLPLTSYTPKALLTVAGKPLIVHLLESLANAGIMDVIINTHHLGEKIQWALGNGHDYGVNITYSVEEELLETGGGIFKALPLLGDEPFLVISSDIFTDYSFGQLRLPNTIPQTLAHLVLAPNPSFHPQGDYALRYDDDNKNIAKITAEDDIKFTYASFGIYHPELFYSFKPKGEKIFRLTSVLTPAIERGLVTGECYHGLWHNLGTVTQLEELRAELGA